SDFGVYTGEANTPKTDFASEEWRSQPQPQFRYEGRFIFLFRGVLSGGASRLRGEGLLGATQRASISLSPEGQGLRRRCDLSPLTEQKKYVLKENPALTQKTPKGKISPLK
ncbi:MAG: hypothetical protein AAGI66_09190, partial [Cyanobacteria bacterium P01_H01_bin.74]